MVEKIKYIANVVIVMLLLATVVIQRDGRVAGVDVMSIFQSDKADGKADVPVETTLADGTRVINSTTLGKDFIGFGGRIPIKLHIKENQIQKIEVEPNSETPSFFDEVVNSGLFEKWNGLSLTDAAALSVDVVSGATYSSTAIIGNVTSAINYANNVEAENDSIFSKITIKDIIGLLVILLGVFITLSKSKNKHLMTLQLVLNVVVLGLWCGSFMSLTTFTTWIANGVNLSLSLVTFTLLCVVIVMPLLGRKGSYCHLHCPMGSAQELIGRIPLTKIKIKPGVTKVLNNLRYYILAALLFMMWLGVGFDLMNYEVFSAFIFSSASTAVLVIAAIFLILSLFIHKPYCRFVCPTGALITLIQKTK